MGGPSHITASGGAKGTDAKYDDMLELSKLIDDVGHEGLATALAGHKYLVEPDVVASALLDPGGVAAFETAMAAALDGPSGLTMAAGEITVRATAIVAAQKAYALTDDLNAKLFDTARWLEGFALASNPLGLLAAAGLGAGAAAEVYTKYDGDWQKWLVDHPGVVDDVISTAPGALTALGLPSTLDSTLDVLADTYPDGKDKTVTVAKNQPDTPPRGMGDLMQGLSRRNDESSKSNLDVRVIKNAQGKATGYVVDVPGTRDWNLPGTTKSANDLGVNVDAMAGNNTVLQQGIEEALHRAKADKTGAPVMLVGHSQGGIVAAESAGALKKQGYNVTHVMTAGSPIGRIDVPDDVQVLSLENNNDIVPHLDAADNPDSANRTTVHFDDKQGNVIDNHRLTTGGYNDVAARLDHNNDPSVAKYRESLGAFTNGSSAQINTYRAAREGVDDGQNPPDVQ